VDSNVKSTEILACGFEVHKMAIQYNNYIAWLLIVTWVLII